MIISKTPLRMSFVGGGSDLSDYYGHAESSFGSVVSTAINKYVYILVNKRFGDELKISYSIVEYANSIEEIQHNLVRECLKYLNIRETIDITYMSDFLPGKVGSGIAGSSAIVVGTLNALHAFRGEHVSSHQLAKEACEIEVDILKHPIGKQDQFAVSYGGFNHIQFNADESVFVNPVIFNRDIRKKLNRNLIMFYTGITARSDTILTEQKEKTKINLKFLDKMVEMSIELKKSLEENDLTKFGDLLLFYCEEEKQDNVRKALCDLKEAPFRFEQQGSRIIYVSD